MLAIDHAEKIRRTLRATSGWGDWPLWVDPVTGLYHDYGGCLERKRQQRMRTAAFEAVHAVVAAERAGWKVLSVPSEW
jgi:hypothetical protein